MNRNTYEEIEVVLDGCMEAMIHGTVEEVPDGDIDEYGDLKTRLVVTDVQVYPVVLDSRWGASYSDCPLDFLWLEWRETLVNAVLQAAQDAWLCDEERLASGDRHH